MHIVIYQVLHLRPPERLDGTGSAVVYTCGVWPVGETV
jgi:hypothetical protein